MSTIAIKFNGQEIELDAQKRGDEIILTLEGGPEISARIISSTADEIILARDGRHIRLKRHRDGQRRQLWVNGQTFHYERLQQFGSPVQAIEGSLSAEIPAVVSQILVEVGQAVEAGEKLLLLESMKMVIPLTANQDGVILAVHCEVGEAVQPGFSLIEIGPFES